MSPSAKRRRRKWRPRPPEFARPSRAGGIDPCRLVRQVNEFTGCEPSSSVTGRTRRPGSRRVGGASIRSTVGGPPQEVGHYYAAVKTLMLVGFIHFSVSAAVAHCFRSRFKSLATELLLRLPRTVRSARL